MSSTGPPETPTTHGKPSTAEASVSRKSYRRKYRKIMVTFEEETKESNNLFREEQRINDISQRLAEQTDQLLQLLVELNSLPQVPRSLRYDLTPPGHTAAPEPYPEEYLDDEDGHFRLQKARILLQLREISKGEYHAIEEELLKSEEFKPSLSYSSLLQIAPDQTSHDKTDGAQDEGIGFITTRDEEQYLQALDNFLDEKDSNPRAHVANHLGSRGADRTIQMEREMQLKNPVSVYNWLRRHQPQVFLQDNEPTSEKPTRATASRSSARKSTGAVNSSYDQWKRDADKYDDVIAPNSAASSKGKRKRDQDGGYRPKGGNARGTKRKKEPKEETARSKRAKKASMG
ncbi:hypothetical protein B0A52_01232 [Exophiala mesophila]|uniref:IEC3 subunit of the Ino80 complex, chromatin re-modelling-domain-containing protein n=1 Tax=Exophiala mesophila TaxID=212818 RepID=A0A438NGU6_EXOME|nr:hypothetical protein B0A52_01232 [Exophiala mesophila]